MSWKPGDVVRLKGQAVPMTVTVVDENASPPETGVAWFDGSGALQHATFAADLLEQCAGAGESRYADIQGSLGVRRGAW